VNGKKKGETLQKEGFYSHFVSSYQDIRIVQKQKISKYQGM